MYVCMYVCMYVFIYCTCVQVGEEQRERERENLKQVPHLASMERRAQTHNPRVVVSSD